MSPFVNYEAMVSTRDPEVSKFSEILSSETFIECL